MIRVSHLSKVFFHNLRRTQVLFDVSLEVKKGTSFGIIGLNGAGKTTLMKHLLGFLFPTSGTVTLWDQSPSSLAVKKRIGYMPEHITLYRHLTAYEFLSFCAGIFHISPLEQKTLLPRLFDRVGLTGKEHQQIRTYSKGMQQRLGIAQALINDPDLLFFDETMSGLDPLGRELMRSLLLEERGKGKTIFFNSHILSDIEVLCDEVGIMHRGHLIDHFSVPAIGKTGKTLEQYFIDRISV